MTRKRKRVVAQTLTSEVTGPDWSKVSISPKLRDAIRRYTLDRYPWLDIIRVWGLPKRKERK